MKQTIENFKNKQERALQILRKIQRFLQTGEDLGIPVNQSVNEKLENAIQNLDGGKLKVALIGGFSEGKTSIAAAWLGRLDKSAMKISHQESSNEVRVFELDDVTLIDTPGLFGFKEQKNINTGEIEKYKDITKKYVSEAHLILYVMNSTNPIKESHKEDLNWLFRDLQLLSRTVFVLSRFDEVADVEDENEYRDAFFIKRDNVIGRLRDLIQLDEQEAENLAVVAISANPFDLGTEYWLENPEKFQSLSHIAELQAATSRKVEQNGGLKAIVEETRQTVIRDILNKQLPVAIANDKKIAIEVEKLSQANNHLEKQLQNITVNLTEARIHLREFITRYFSGLILQTNGISIDTFNDFFEREIGSEGVIINSKVQNEFERQFQSINQDVSRVQISYQNEVDHYNSTLGTLGRQGVHFAVKNGVISKEGVLFARDALVSGGKLIGIDLSNLLKFKPWGATNLASGLSGAIVAAGLALEIWDSIQQAKKEQVFQKLKAGMKEKLEAQRAEILKLINSEHFERNFFPNLLELHESVSEMNATIQERRLQQSKFNEWRKYGESIEVEFTMN